LPKSPSSNTAGGITRAGISTNAAKRAQRPSRAEAEAAVRTLLAWAGDNPDRAELRLTPARVVEAYLDYFSGYTQNPFDLLLEPVLDDAAGYDDMVLLNAIPVLSHCEHHISPFAGRACVAYLPGARLTGLSRLSRVVDVLARRLQTQEALTQQIADCLNEGLAPRGVAVLIEAEHQCIAARGIRQAGLKALTTRFTGAFETDGLLQDRFLRLARRDI
jgi:GTP cyclohydrolase IA